MKRIVSWIFVFFFLHSSNLYAQNSETVLNEKSVEFGLYFSTGQRIMSIPEGIILDQTYEHNIKVGYGLNTDLTYFISQKHGICFNYDFLNTYGSFYTFNAPLFQWEKTYNSFNIHNFQIGYSRLVHLNSKVNLRIPMLLGLVQYNNYGESPSETGTISGSGPSLSFKLFLDIKIKSPIILSLGTGIHLSKLNSLDYNTNKYNFTLDSNIGNMGTSTINVFLGMRLSKY